MDLDKSTATAYFLQGMYVGTSWKGVEIGTETATYNGITRNGNIFAHTRHWARDEKEVIDWLYEEYEKGSF